MKINHIKLRLIVVFFVVFNVSCTKVIDVDLNSSNPVPVADARILKDSTALVRLSYTTDYFNNELPQFIENARIKITTQNNKEEILEYVSDGYYKGENIVGTINSSYRIEIEFEDQKFNAESKLLQPTEILEFTFEETNSNNPTTDETVYVPKIKFNSISDKTNYFMLRFWVNGILENDRYITIEKENPGEIITYEPFRLSFEKNDIVQVRVYSIDKESKDYYQQLNDSHGGMMNSSTPYNAKSNLGPDILGFFLASSFDESTAIAE